MSTSENRPRSLRERWATGRTRRKSKRRERALRRHAAEADRDRYNPNKPDAGGLGGGDGGVGAGGM
jgi:hypothetical protein